MIVAAIASLVGLAAVLVALYREAPPVETLPGREWDALPAPHQVARGDFRVVLRGYDPPAVDAHLRAAAEAYADLLAVSPPSVVAMARQRALVRRGGRGGPVEVPAWLRRPSPARSPDEDSAVAAAPDARAGAPGPAPAPGGSALGPADPDDLRTQAALGALEGRATGR